MTRGELQAIANLAVKHNLIVITDEIYAELTFEGEHVSIASLPGMRERTIFLHGFSKAYAMTGFRIGFACGPETLVGAMTRIHQYSMLCASIVSQEAALEALRNGEEPMLEMREAYRQRRNFMVQALNDMGLECHRPRGSFYAFPACNRPGSIPSHLPPGWCRRKMSPQCPAVRLAPVVKDSCAAALPPASIRSRRPWSGWRVCGSKRKRAESLSPSS